MLDALTAWLAALWKATFGALWDFIQDAFIWALQAVLEALSALIAAIPVPDFVSTGMQAILGGLPGPILYLLVGAGLPSALALVGAGFAFRMTRKLLTLFQW